MPEDINTVFPPIRFQDTFPQILAYIIIFRLRLYTQQTLYHKFQFRFFILFPLIVFYFRFGFYTPTRPYIVT